MSTPDETRRGASIAASQGYVTGDMVAQWAYCPRRLHLMYAEGRWAGSVDTDEGTVVHRRVDSGDGMLREPGGDDAPRAQSSVMIDIPEDCLRAKLDLLESAGSESGLVPIEYKRGRPPEEGSVPWPPDRVQVLFQALLLRRNGQRCVQAVVYYAQAKARIDVKVDAAGLADVEEAIAGVRRVLSESESPQPLEDSPKCNRCSLGGLCLPDETRLLGSRGTQAVEGHNAPHEVRRLVPPRDDALPLYVQEQGARVGKRGEQLVVSKGRETLAKVRLLDISQLVLAGNVGITAQALAILCRAGIPIVHLSRGHWFHGITVGPSLRNAFDRAAQFACSRDERACLALASTIVKAKGTNQRTLLRRNGPSGAPVLKEMKRAIAAVSRAKSLAELLGYEGQLAALYFGAFGSVIKPRRSEKTDSAASACGQPLSFDFSGRNRRPPKDPINALLSFGYALLAKEATVALLAAGLDPYWGIYHQPRHGRPALALDLMEEMRPLIVDSAVLTAVNTGAVAANDFEFGSNGCALKASGRKAFLRTYEARMDQLITHPIFDYRVSWRRTLMVQAQLLSRAFRGSIPEYLPITTR